MPLLIPLQVYRLFQCIFRRYKGYTNKSMKRCVPIKLVLGIPKPDKSKHANLLKDNWTPLREPKNILHSLLLSAPIMIVCALLTLAIIHIFVPLSAAYFGINTGQLSIAIDLPFIAAIVTVFIAHELIHLLLIPGFVKSDKTYMGLTYLGLFVYTEEVLSKKRHIAISVFPFLFISILLPVLLGITGLLNPILIIVILLNSLGSSVDILSLISILSQVPSNAHLTSNGMLTYWKK